jgi:hypothetical protein
MQHTAGPDPRSPAARVRVRVAMVLLLGVLAAGAWFVLDDRTAKVDRARAEREEPAAEAPGPELVGRGARAPGAAGEAAPRSATARTSAWRLEGRVTGAQGESVAGASVEALLVRGTTTSLGRVTTDRDGGYAIDLAPVRALSRFALAGARIRVYAAADGHAPAEADPEVEWPADKGADLSVRADVTLPAGDVLRGRVVARGGEPVAGAEVACCDGEFRVGWDRTRPDGRFVLSAVPGGPDWLVVAMSEEHGIGRLALRAGGERDLRDLVVEPGPTVEGSVVYADGSPVAGVSVRGAVVDRLDRCVQGFWPSPRTRSGPDGSFRILLPGGGACTLEVDGSQARASCQAGDRNVRLVVQEHRVRLSVVDAEGRALPGLSWLALSLSPEHAALLDALEAGRATPDDLRDPADVYGGNLLGEDGTADFWTEPKSAWLFLTDAPGSAPGEAALRVPAEGNESAVRVVLREQVGGGRLGLRFLDPDGKQVPLLRVKVSTALGSDLFRGPLAGEGVLGPFPPGLVRLEAQQIERPDQMGWWIPPLDSWLLAATGTAAIRAGETTPAVLHGAWGGRVRVLLRTPAGGTAAAAGLNVRLVPQDGGAPELLMGQSADKPDSFSSELQPDRPTLGATLFAPVTYRIEATVSGKGWNDASGQALVTVRAREITDVTVDLAAR